MSKLGSVMVIIVDSRPWNTSVEVQTGLLGDWLTWLLHGMLRLHRAVRLKWRDCDPGPFTLCDFSSVFESSSTDYQT